MTTTLRSIVEIEEIIEEHFHKPLGYKFNSKVFNIIKNSLWLGVTPDVIKNILIPTDPLDVILSKVSFVESWQTSSREDVALGAKLYNKITSLSLPKETLVLLLDYFHATNFNENSDPFSILNELHPFLQTTPSEKELNLVLLSIRHGVDYHLFFKNNLSFTNKTCLYESLIFKKKYPDFPVNLLFNDDLHPHSITLLYKIMVFSFTNKHAFNFNYKLFSDPKTPFSILNTALKLLSLGADPKRIEKLVQIDTADDLALFQIKIEKELGRFHYNQDPDQKNKKNSVIH